MDPATITTAVVSTLAPYLARGAKAIAEAAGDVVAAKAGKLLERLKQRWIGDAEASDSLRKFEEKPQRYAPVVEDILHEKIIADPKLGEELQQIVDELGPKIEVLQKLAEADGVVGIKARRITRGDVRVTQEIDRARNVTGAEFDEIG